MEKASRTLRLLEQVLGDSQSNFFRTGDGPDAVQESSFDESYEVRPACLVSIANEFGHIRFDTWDTPVVRVQATLKVGAQSLPLAGEILEQTGIDVDHDKDNVEVRLTRPTTIDAGGVSISVDYTITVPQSARILCENYFGDTYVHGVGGSVGIESRFGTVDLRNLAGEVNVRASGGGEYTLKAHGLRRGGTFDLRSMHSEFSAVSGMLAVKNYWGSVALRDMAPEVDVDVSSESGPVHLYVPEGREPDVEATVLFGALKSDIAMNSQTRKGGNLVIGRSPNIESTQHVGLTVIFDDLYVHRAGLTADAPPPPEGELMTASWERAAPLTPEIEVVVNSALGDIRVEGVDEPELWVNASKHVLLQSSANAAGVLDALQVTVQELDSRIIVETRAEANMDGLGCLRHRVDLLIRCPRDVKRLKIGGGIGHTTVSGIGGPLEVDQQEGTLQVQNVKGQVDLTNRSGNVTVQECGGPLVAVVKDGTATTADVFGKQTVDCTAGKTIIERPGGDVIGRSRGGDIRVMAHEGIGGNFDVQVDGGDLSVLLPFQADATLDVTARNGSTHTAIPLSGGKDKDGEWLKGKLGEGAHNLILKTKDGDIVIDVAPE
ncbi:MAG: DUF4097 domain-containing protein [bacterium]|nr:DUF4097 domain-containing protein [bacterium]